MSLSETGEWVYTDTGRPVAAHVDRACGYCGGDNTKDGHDHCIGTLRGVVNACCGHGIASGAYVVLKNGCRLSGFGALLKMGERRMRE